MQKYNFISNRDEYFRLKFFFKKKYKKTFDQYFDTKRYFCSGTYAFKKDYYLAKEKEFNEHLEENHLNQ